MAAGKRLTACRVCARRWHPVAKNEIASRVGRKFGHVDMVDGLETPTPTHR